MKLTDAQIKTIAFIGWPLVVPIALIVIGIACVVGWFLIPFSKVVRDGNNIKLTFD